MFEGKSPIPASAEGHPAAAQAEEELRALSWSDLVAKLSAEKDLRKVLAEPNGTRGASFDEHSAQHLAAMHEVEANDIQDAVNPDDLGNRKGTGGINSARDRQHRPATRGNT